MSNREAALERSVLQLKLEAVAVDSGASRAAAADVARRLVEAGAEVRPDGRVRLSNGEGLADAMERLRQETPEAYWTRTTATPPPPVVEPPAKTIAERRRRASDRLAKSNSEDPKPRLNGVADDD